MLRKKRKLKHTENNPFSPIDSVSKDVLIHIFDYIELSGENSNYKIVNKFWYQIYKNHFLPKKKKEALELLVGKDFTEKLIKENHGIDGAIQKLKEIIDFDAILNKLNLQWLNISLLKQSFRDLEKSIIRLEKIIWYDVNQEDEMQAKWRLSISELNEMGMQDAEIKNCGAILIATNYLKNYGVGGKGYSLIRLYAQARFDKGVAFLLANGAAVNDEGPDGMNLLQATIFEPTENDPEGETKCLEILLFHEAPFLTNDEDRAMLIKDIFFYCKLSAFILERISIDFLLEALPEIFKKFTKVLLKSQKNITKELYNQVNDCHNNLTLLMDLLIGVNLTLWQRYSDEEIAEIKCFPGLCESLTGSDNFEHLVFSEAELEAKSQEIDFKIITDEQITLFEKRNLLITLLLMTNKELFNYLEKRDAVPLLSIRH